MTDAKLYDALLFFRFNQEVLPVSPCFFNLSHPFGYRASPTPRLSVRTAVLRYRWSFVLALLFFLDRHDLTK